jgi:hypothetical protein
MNMEWLVLLSFIIVIIFFVYSRRGSPKNNFPYESREVIFSFAERSFFGVLVQAVGENAVVLGKVRIADVMKPQKGLNRSDWQIAFNRISAKHFDYVVCTPDTLSIIAVVELDDRSHAKKKSMERDQFVEGACSSAGITLHRVKARAAYNVASLRELIFPPVLAIESEPSPLGDTLGALVDAQSEDSMLQARCPKCSSELVRRVAKKGKQKGTEFLGCSAFPKCRYTETPEA